ncbi:hypothetical protein D3C71_1829130 [compost metagenome]
MNALRATCNVLQDRFLLECQRYDGIDVQAKTILDFLRIADAARELAAEDGKCNTGQQPQHQRQCDDQRLLGLDCSSGFDGSVEQSHVADLAFLHKAQL